MKMSLYARGTVDQVVDCIRRSVDFRITSKDEGGPFSVYRLRE